MAAQSNYGVNRRQVAKQLRATARQIERGEVETRSVTQQQIARDDRYPVTTLRVSFAPKKK